MVFSGDVPDLKSAWAAPPATAIGVVTGITAAALLIAPRLTTTFLPLLILLWVWASWGEVDFRAFLPKLDGLTISFGALLLLTLISSFWSEIPWAAFPKILMLGVVAFASLATAKLVSGEDRATVLRASEGLWIGLMIGLVYYLAEAVTHQGIRIWLVNALGVPPEYLQPEKAFKWWDGRLIAISDAGFTRAATPITLMLWPALMAAQGSIARPWAKWIPLLLVALAVPAIFFSPQETSKVAIVAGLIAFGLAWSSRIWAKRVVATLWVVSCLAIVPVALLAHRMNLHNADWMQGSAQHRIIIWNYTAETAMKTPLLGIGAYMTYLTGDKRSADAVREPDEHFKKTLSQHAHNFFLQIWLELGAVGAVLFAIVGWQITRRIGQMAHDIQPYAFATFISAHALMFSSYGIWQAWLIALFGLAPILFAIGARALETSRPTVFGRTG